MYAYSITIDDKPRKRRQTKRQLASTIAQQIFEGVCRIMKAHTERENQQSLKIFLKEHAKCNKRMFLIMFTFQYAFQGAFTLLVPFFVIVRRGKLLAERKKKVKVSNEWNEQSLPHVSSYFVHFLGVEQKFRHQICFEKFSQKAFWWRKHLRLKPTRQKRRKFSIFRNVMKRLADSRTAAIPFVNYVLRKSKHALEVSFFVIFQTRFLLCFVPVTHTNRNSSPSA